MSQTFLWPVINSNKNYIQDASTIKKKSVGSYMNPTGKATKLVKQIIFQTFLINKFYSKNSTFIWKQLIKLVSYKWNINKSKKKNIKIYHVLFALPYDY